MDLLVDNSKEGRKEGTNSRFGKIRPRLSAPKGYQKTPLS
jgi:hypothetical protein